MNRKPPEIEVDVEVGSIGPVDIAVPPRVLRPINVCHLLALDIRDLNKMVKERRFPQPILIAGKKRWLWDDAIGWLDSQLMNQRGAAL